MNLTTGLKKILRRKTRAAEKNAWKKNPDTVAYRSKMIGRFGNYEFEYFWA